MEKRYINETKRLKYQKLLKKYKDKKNISELENLLSSYNSKTCNYNKFKKFIKIKNILNSILSYTYKEEIFRKYKWYSYINKKKTTEKLKKEIKKKFGKNPKLIIGDWSQ